MTMAEVIRGMVTGSNDVFQLALDGKARKYVVGNICILGILFGLSNLMGSLQSDPALPLNDKFVLITPFIFSMAGIVTICAAVIGLTLVYWAAAKAFGGQGGFGLILDLIGLAALPFWILAPLLNYSLRFTSPGLIAVVMYIIASLAFLWSFILIRQSMITGQGLTLNKATIAVTAMWVFSISSVYVFLP